LTHFRRFLPRGTGQFRPVGVRGVRHIVTCWAARHDSADTQHGGFERAGGGKGMAAALDAARRFRFKAGCSPGTRVRDLSIFPTSAVSNGTWSTRTATIAWRSDVRNIGRRRRHDLGVAALKCLPVIGSSFLRAFILDR